MRKQGGVVQTDFGGNDIISRTGTVFSVKILGHTNISSAVIKM